MKAVYFPALWQAAGAIALTFGIAACVPQAEPPAPTPPPVVTPAPTPAPTPTPTPIPPPVVEEPVFENYLDAPQTEGTWIYFSDFTEPRGTTRAVFADPGEMPLLVLSCSTRRYPQIRLTAVASSAGERTIEIVTETATQSFNEIAGMRRTGLYKAMPIWEKMDGSISVPLTPGDPILDAMAITKGRIAISVEGERTLYVPAWVEISRVIEDCR